MAPYDTEACDDISYGSESSAEAKRVMTEGGILTSNEIGGEFDAMLGLQQSAKMSFVARTNLGELSATLKESLKLGAWASGKSTLKMKEAGMSAEMKFMGRRGR